MLDRLVGFANDVIEFMKSEIIIIDEFDFSLWEILIVSTGAIVLAKVIGSMLNISE